MKVKVFVSRGRTVYGDGGVKYGPGEVIELDSEQVAFMKERGFVQSEPPILTPPQVDNPSGIGMQHQNAQGPRFTR